MKKIVALLVLGSLFSFGFSQQDSLLKTKSGNVILPQKGDFAIGIGANSIFDFVGNMFSSSGDNHLRLDLINGNVIYGKYFLSSQSALRLKLGLYQSNSTYENSVFDDLDNTKTKKVTDKYEYSYSDVSISVGFEKRKGKGRLQVSYGGELGFYIDSYDRKYTYGNAFSSTNTNPTSTYDFFGPNAGQNGSRPIENKRDNGFSVGARLFTGIEYFVFPKISIGGEIGLAYVNRFNGKNKNSTEMWDYSNDKVKVDEYESKSTSSYTSTDIFNGQIFLLFHF